MNCREVHAFAKDAAMRQQLAMKLRSKLDTQHRKHVDASKNGTIQSQVRGLCPSAHLSGDKYIGICILNTLYCGGKLAPTQDVAS